MPATYIETRTVPLDELTPYPGNAKRGDVVGILASLRRNAQYRGLVVRQVENGPLVVLAGNHTMQALAAHGAGPCGQTVHVGDQEQPCGVCAGQPWDPAARCEIITCDDSDARRINLADNRLAELGTYDNDALIELLSSLDGDFDGTGFNEADLDGLIGQPDTEAEVGDAPVEDIDPVWGVVVTCRDERQQADLLERLDSEGFAVRALM